MVQFLSRNFMELPLSCFQCVWLFNTQERHPHADHAVGQRKRKGRGQERQKQKEQQERWSPGGWVTIWTIWTSGRITSHNQDHENVMRVSCHVCTHFEDCHCPYLVHILSTRRWSRQICTRSRRRWSENLWQTECSNAYVAYLGRSVFSWWYLMMAV